MKIDIIWSLDHYDGYSHKVMLVGDYKGVRFVTSYTDNLLCLWLAKKRIEWRFSLLNK